MPTPRSRSLRSIAVLVASLALTGCSVLSARKLASEWEPSQAPDCRRGKGTVGLDATMAVALGVVALVAVGSDEAEVAGLSLAGGIAYTGSGVYGSRAANRCRAAIQEHEDYLAARLFEPGPGVEEAAAEPAAPTPAPTASRDPSPAPEEEEEEQDQEEEEEAQQQPDEWAAFWIEVFP